MGNVLPAECVSGVEEVYGRVYLCVWVWKVSRRSRPVVVGRGHTWVVVGGREGLPRGGRGGGRGRGRGCRKEGLVRSGVGVCV
jgi:hypothetical protein